MWLDDSSTMHHSSLGAAQFLLKDGKSRKKPTKLVNTKTKSCGYFCLTEPCAGEPFLRPFQAADQQWPGQQLLLIVNAETKHPGDGGKSHAWHQSIQQNGKHIESLPGAMFMNVAKWELNMLHKTNYDISIEPVCICYKLYWYHEHI